MATRTSLTKTLSVSIVAEVLALVFLAGCAGPNTNSAPGSGTPSPQNESAGYWRTALQHFIDANGELPPSSAPYGDADAFAASKVRADAAWSRLQAEYLNAERPSGSFVHWAASADPDVQKCITQAGGTEESGVDQTGVSTIGFSGPASAEYAVAVFNCSFVLYPARPEPPETSAQLSYVYDYWTTFVVPCYQAHGVSTDPAPSRAEFLLENKPDAVAAPWAPLPPSAADAPNPVFDGSEAVCPLAPPGVHHG